MTPGSKITRKARMNCLWKLGGLVNLSDKEKAAIRASCKRSNMAIYKCRDDFVDRAAVCAFAANFGLRQLDHHLCANEDGVSELSVASRGIRAGYVPYSNRSLSWHTDGYYNDPSRQIRAVLLHCANSAASGGENALFDPEIAYIRLRRREPPVYHRSRASRMHDHSGEFGCAG